MKIAELFNQWDKNDDVTIKSSKIINNTLLKIIIPLFLSTSMAYAQEPIQTPLTPTLNIQILKDHVANKKLNVTAKILESHQIEDMSTTVLSTLDTKNNLTCNFLINPISNQEVIDLMTTITPQQAEDFISLHEEAHCLHFTNFIPTDALNDYLSTNQNSVPFQTQAEESFADSFAYLMMVAKSPKDSNNIIAALFSFRTSTGERKSNHNTTKALEITYNIWKNLEHLTKQAIHEQLNNPVTAVKIEEKFAKIASIAAYNGAYHFVTSNFNDIPKQFTENIKAINIQGEMSKIFPSSSEKLNASRQKEINEIKTPSM